MECSCGRVAECLNCAKTFHTHAPTRAKYCSGKCKAEARRVPCTGCGAPMWFGSTLAAKPVCLTCRRSQHGTVSAYKHQKCRCEDCRAANAKAVRDYVAKRKADGRPIPKRRYPDSDRHYSMTKAERVAIYERDSWTCQLCNEPLDVAAHFNDPLAPTLDHIVPQSVSASPDHSPDNLRAAHRICNARRGNRVEYAAA